MLDPITIADGAMTSQEFYYLLSDIGGYGLYLVALFFLWRMLRKKK